MYSATKTKKRHTKNTKKAMLLIIAVILLVGGVTLVLLELTGHTKFFNKSAPTANQTQNNGTETEEKTTASSSAPVPGGTAMGPKDGDADTQPTRTLLAPDGTFVSNHRARVSASQETQQSTCTTTPGATCQITFTKDGATKQLPAKTTDAEGNVYWSWKLSDVGLTKGSWKVTAVAALDGQTKTADDPLNLEVSD